MLKYIDCLEMEEHERLENIINNQWKETTRSESGSFR